MFKGFHLVKYIATYEKKNSSYKSYLDTITVKIISNNNHYPQTNKRTGQGKVNYINGKYTIVQDTIQEKSSSNTSKVIWFSPLTRQCVACALNFPG